MDVICSNIFYITWIFYICTLIRKIVKVIKNNKKKIYNKKIIKKYLE